MIIKSRKKKPQIAQGEKFFKKIDSQRAICWDISARISWSTKDSEDTKKQIHENHAALNKEVPRRLDTHGYTLKSRRPLFQARRFKKHNLSGSIISAALREKIGREIPLYRLRTNHRPPLHVIWNSCWIVLPASYNPTERQALQGLQTRRGQKSAGAQYA